MAWFDFNTVQDDLVNLLAANVTSANEVKKEADERDYAFHNMPLVDVRLTDMDPTVLAGQNYYVETTFEIQVTTYDLSDFNEAATLRDTVFGDVIETVRQNAHFSAGLESTIVGPGTFNTAKDDKSGAFMAAATVQVQVKAYIDA